LNLTQLSLVQNADLLEMNKCRLIPESFFINVPVVAQYFARKKVIVVFSVHIQTNIVRQSKKKYLAMLKVYKSK